MNPPTAFRIVTGRLTVGTNEKPGNNKAWKQFLIISQTYQ
jgi:hypothetical protein